MKHASQRGLTLIETSATVAIAAVLTSSAVSGFGGMLERRQVEGVAAELASDLQFVRSEAVARNQSVRIGFGTTPGGASCYVIHTGPAGACACSEAGPASCAAPARLIKAVQAPAGGKVRVRPENNVTSMLYNPVRGTTSPAARITVASAAGPGLQHVVSLVGRVRTCSPDGEWRGYRAC